MNAHIRANLILLGLTIALGAIAYPLAVLAIGRALFPSSSTGSLVADADGKPIGSRHIAQEFKGDEWFQPRPSAAGYNASASGGSNWGASSPKLRDRVARQIGPIAVYRAGTHSTNVQQDIEAWHAAKPDRLATWLKEYPTSAANWLGDSGNARAIEAWTAANPGDFWDTFAARHPGAFPDVENDAIKPTTNGSAIHATYFDSWLRDNPERARDLEPISTDAATASGSGLDPHVTLRNARGQVERVASAWATKTKRDPVEVRDEVAAILAAAAFEPLAGLAGGEPLVNVLEVNFELAKRYKK